MSTNPACKCEHKFDKHRLFDVVNYHIGDDFLCQCYTLMMTDMTTSCMVRKEMSYTIKIVGVIYNTTTGKMGYFCMCESRPARHRVDLHKKVPED